MAVRARRSEGDGVPEEERLGEAHAEAVEDAEVQKEGEGEAEAEVQPDALGLALSLALPLELPDTAGEALSPRDGEALPVVLDVPLPLLARAMRKHVASAGLQRSGCLALRNLVVKSPERVQAAFDEGAL